MIEPSSFLDPVSYPVVFNPRKPTSITFGQAAYPITFGFSSSPRYASIEALAIDQNNTLFVDRDISNDPDVGLFSNNTSHRFELFVEGKDIESNPMHIKIWTSSSTPMFVRPGAVAHVRQQASGSNIGHIFSMEPSTQLLDPVSGVYPTARLNLSFSTRLRNDESEWAAVELPDKTETEVMLNPSGVTGLIDILAEVKLEWYTDSNRTLPYRGTPPVNRKDRFGIRFYISDFGVFSNQVQIYDSGQAVAESMLPKSTLDKSDIPLADALYFGSGSRSSDLFFGIAEEIEIGDNGLPIQDGLMVASYELVNQLEDIEFSSSNSSSTSSLNSSSSPSESSKSSVSSGSSV